MKPQPSHEQVHQHNVEHRILVPAGPGDIEEYSRRETSGRSRVFCSASTRPLIGDVVTARKIVMHMRKNRGYDCLGWNVTKNVIPAFLTVKGSSTFRERSCIARAFSKITLRKAFKLKSMNNKRQRCPYIPVLNHRQWCQVKLLSRVIGSCFVANEIKSKVTRECDSRHVDLIHEEFESAVCTWNRSSITGFQMLSSARLAVLDAVEASAWPILHSQKL